MAEENPKLQEPSQEDLLTNIDKVSSMLDNLYLHNLSRDFVALPFDSYNQYGKDGSYRVGYESNIRGIQVLRWVYDKEEKIIDRFKNILAVFSENDSNLGLVIRRTPEACEMLFCLKNETRERSRFDDSRQNIALLEKSIRGNFPGTEIHHINIDEDWVGLAAPKSIASLTSIPSEKSEGFISQGLEKLLDGIVPQSEDENYTVLLLAEPLSQEQISTIRSGYEDLASGLRPFAEYQFSAGTNRGTTEGEFSSLSKTDGINEAITKTNSVNLGLSAGITKGDNIVESLLHKLFGGPQGPNFGINAGFSHSRARTKGENHSDTTATGRNYGLTEGSSTTATYTYKSFAIEGMLEKLDIQRKRIEHGRALGMWNFASYVIANNAQVSLDVVNFLRSLMQGEQSHMEACAINHWEPRSESDPETSNFNHVLAYIRHFTHPVFANSQDIIVSGFQYDPLKIMTMTPAAVVSTPELASSVSFPRRSVPGLPALTCARFGRNVMLRSGNGAGGGTNRQKPCPLGVIYHMHSAEEHSPVGLERSELTAHTFITGSTGAGKSNTIYKLLSELCFQSEDPAKFLVIEPAKGEYKNVFGGCEGVSVYGTNPKKEPLLRLNPFSFPEDIHVLEHIDRLVEVFNACWPMYAAMPAVLKDAIEASYASCGWSLTHSTCKLKCFPTFAVLLEKLPEVIGSSSYSKDTKSDYAGALMTRVKSLTNGINGPIFCSESEIPGSALFDENVIIDLSRIGSIETKSLLMGILMIKLQEYRMDRAQGSNAELRHVTVLEEAHHLLRRTSQEQSQESSNLQGKSVEMLANAIAEMRTYGEGFIIADQSPGLLDLSVIRNTNTKIIMRLPDESDRILVGKAAGLNDDQVAELAKLDRGVAAVFQSCWLEPVLCQVQRFSGGKEYSGCPPEQIDSPKMDALFGRILYGAADGDELSDEQVDKFMAWTDGLRIRREVKMTLRQAIEQKTPLSEDSLGMLLYCLVQGQALVRKAEASGRRPEQVCAAVEQEVADRLQVSECLAEEIRKRIFVYAAEHLQPEDPERRENLLYYGGVQW